MTNPSVDMQFAPRFKHLSRFDKKVLISACVDGKPL